MESLTERKIKIHLKTLLELFWLRVHCHKVNITKWFKTIWGKLTKRLPKVIKSLCIVAKVKATDYDYDNKTYSEMLTSFQQNEQEYSFLKYDEKPQHFELISFSYKTKWRNQFQYKKQTKQKIIWKISCNEMKWNAISSQLLFEIIVKVIQYCCKLL